MAKFIAGLVGLVTAYLLFPFGGTTGCSGGHSGGECVSWNDSILVRYEGENGAIGMAVAVGAGIAAALFVYFLAKWLMERRRRQG